MENKTGYTTITNDEYKQLVLDNDRLQRELDESILAEINSGRECNKLRQCIVNILDNFVSDNFNGFKLEMFNVTEDRLLNYLNKNLIDEINKIKADKRKAEEENTADNTVEEKKEDEENE